jgi:hypothetical protein
MLVFWGRLAAVFMVALGVFGLGNMPAAAAARDEPETPVALHPHDIGMVVQPAATRLPPLPADFVRIEDQWLVLELPSSVRERAAALARDGDAFRVRLSADLGQVALEHVLVRVARTPEQMAELAPEGAPPPAYASGVAYPSLHLVLLTLKSPDSWEAPDLAEVFRHELTHVALSDAVLDRHVPRWFEEGLAIHESGEIAWGRMKELWDATLSRRLLPLSSLDADFPADRSDVRVAYSESADFVRFLMRDTDRARFGSLIERTRTGTPFDRSLEDAYGTDLRKLEYEWREGLSRRFGIVPALTGGGLLWVVISALAVVAWVKRRRYAKQKLAQWAREEAEMDAAVSAGARGTSEPLGIAVVAASAPPPDGSTAGPPPVVPVVEHEGRWYTLH